MTIKQRAGHRRFETTEGYIREARESSRRQPGAPFPKLPARLLGLARFGEGLLREPREAENRRAASGEGGIRKRQKGASRVLKGREGHSGRAGYETPGTPSRPPQPKPAESNPAIVAAIKAALDEGRYERAAALLDVLRRTEAFGSVVPIQSAGADPRK